MVAGKLPWRRRGGSETCSSADGTSQDEAESTDGETEGAPPASLRRRSSPPPVVAAEQRKESYSFPASTSGETEGAFCAALEDDDGEEDSTDVGAWWAGMGGERYDYDFDC